MATKKKTTAKKTAPTKKSAVKGKRYTDQEKAEILAFVEAQGRGGQTAAVKKFGVSALTISTWRKKAGVSAASPKAPKALDTIPSFASSTSFTCFSDSLLLYLNHQHG